LANTFEERFRAEYGDVLRLARARVAREHAPISTVTLANELYLALRGREDKNFDSRGAFMAYVSRAMRSLLIDMARERMAQKRSADLVPLSLGLEVPDLGGTPEQLVAFDEALNRLKQLDVRLERVAELRVVMGMEIGEIAEVLAVSEPTVTRDWRRAKAFLIKALGAEP